MRLLVAVSFIALLSGDAQAGSFLNFESGHVRPLAFVPTADLLFAVNTPDNRLAVFDVSAGGLVRVAEVPVGLEPVAVAARTLPGGDVEAWVVNHLSDSLSLVRVDPGAPAEARVTRTLLVGDEPRDIVFAGSGGDRVFVTTAHRGQNRPGDPQLLTPDTPRADVWVFDADAPGAALGGTPITIVECFGDTPRALATSPDGSTVYAAVFHSGNGTMTLNERTVSANGGLPPAPPGSTPGAPLTGLIVAHDPSTDEWNDELGRDWSPYVPFGFPDYDVFAIDADAPTPAVTASVPRVGTTIFDLAVRPDNGKVYASNTAARNAVRFEPVLRGHLAETRVSVIDGTSVTPVPLNTHVNYGVVPGPPAEIEETLAHAVDMAFSPDGGTLYVAALGSGKIGVFDADLLEAGISTPRGQLDVGGGPTGLVLDVVRDRLYVMNRFDHAIAIVDGASLPTRSVAATVSLGYDPSPAAVNDGRRFLYDARNSSAHGDESCASCHMFGDMDDIAWDLGDPTGAVLAIDNPSIDLAGGFGSGATYHPMKGPMLTQSLRGLADTGPLHWRGDRSGATAGGSALDSAANFKTFDIAFTDLLGRAALLPNADMDAFTDFVLTIRYPPNPVRPLAGFKAQQAAGEDVFLNVPSDGAAPCVACHDLPLGTGGRVGVGFPFFQAIKVPHLRNIYQKVGRFGLVPNNDHDLTPYTVGDQMRAFGLEFNGSLSSVLDFHGPQFGLTPPQRTQVADFVLAFDTGLDAAVGQQVTATPSTFGDSAVAARIAVLAARDDANACELVATGFDGSERRGWIYVADGEFRSDRLADPPVSEASLRGQAAAAGAERTFTCVPPLSGSRIGIDRDDDGVGDADEREHGSDPEDPASLPATFELVRVRTSQLTMRDRSREPANPGARKLKFKATTKDDPAANRIVPPAAGSVADPRTGSALLDVFNAAGTGEVVTIVLPPSGWSALGDPAQPRGYKFDETGPIAKVTVLKDRLQIKGGDVAWRYTLDEPAQGAIAVRLRLGTGVVWCAAAPGDPDKDKVDKFAAERDTPPPISCPKL